jgi:hypothetical protein
MSLHSDIDFRSLTLLSREPAPNDDVQWFVQTSQDPSAGPMMTCNGSYKHHKTLLPGRSRAMIHRKLLTIG